MVQKEDSEELCARAGAESLVDRAVSNTEELHLELKGGFSSQKALTALCFSRMSIVSRRGCWSNCFL